MNHYTHDLSLFDFADLSDPISHPISRHHHLYHRSSSSSDFYSGNNDNFYYYEDNSTAKTVTPKSPPRHRHDGTSPLPLGMDWSLPPRNWDGRDSVWPHDPHTGWSYCVTVPSWSHPSKPGGSDSAVFYRVQVGIQSPEGITTTRGILRRYREFLNLLSELKKAFPKKTLPPAPPKRIMRRKSGVLLEERRCSLEDLIEKLLSDIDISRSAPVGTFLELEAAVRSYFDDVNQQSLYANSSTIDIIPSSLDHTDSDASLPLGNLSVASDHGNDFPEISELGPSSHSRGNNVDLGMDTSTSEQNITDPMETVVRKDIFNQNSILHNLESLRKMHARREKNITGSDKHSDNISEGKYFFGDGNEPLPRDEYQTLDGHFQRLSTESVGSDLSSTKAGDIPNLGMGNLFGRDSLDLPAGAPQRLDAAKTDMEDLIARLNQEIAVRQFLTTKVKDLEVDLETTSNSCKENMQQVVLSERERFTQMQWDAEELRKQCLELELKLKSEQDERERVESVQVSTIQENEMLLKQLEAAREELANLHKHHDELELKSKADMKFLVKEVKSLRSSQSDLKQELRCLVKEKIEVEEVLQNEKQRTETVTAANARLLHECEILQNRLQECSVNFFIKEGHRLILDTSSPSDTIDLLTTSDNRIGLLLAEAQLLSQDVENYVAGLDENTTDNKLKKLLTDIFVDNARLRMQVNSVIRCTINENINSEKEDEKEETATRETVLSKFLER
ncbi:PX domain-containing protein EREX isoform X2 [Mercurialis annua]|uniref:PX domain-containing protein EREX isoform X2 n=1 Tax=Mercurialis annua TaxID=3986 RepID=UPI00215FCBE7|nr:PX domain-containing protein EREX isoform X2 [Mercurialis annua]